MDNEDIEQLLKDKVFRLSDSEMAMLRDDPEVVKIAVKYDGVALKSASDQVKSNRDVVLEAVKKNGFALFQGDEKFADDELLARVAMDKHIGVYPYLSERLRGFEDLAFRAITENPDFYKNVGIKLKNNRELAIIALEGQTKGEALANMGEELRNDYNIVMKSCKKFPGSIFDAGEKILGNFATANKSNPHKVIEAIKLDNELKLKPSNTTVKSKKLKI